MVSSVSKTGDLFDLDTLGNNLKVKKKMGEENNVYLGFFVVRSKRKCEFSLPEIAGNMETTKRQVVIYFLLLRDSTTKEEEKKILERNGYRIGC